jgi:hypothetical protein
MAPFGIVYRDTSGLKIPEGVCGNKARTTGVSGVRTEPAHIAPEECGDAISAFRTGADEQSIGSELLGRCTATDAPSLQE